MTLSVMAEPCSAWAGRGGPEFHRRRCRRFVAIVRAFSGWPIPEPNRRCMNPRMTSRMCERDGPPMRRAVTQPSTPRHLREATPDISQERRSWSVLGCARTVSSHRVILERRAAPMPHDVRESSTRIGRSPPHPHHPADYTASSSSKRACFACASVAHAQPRMRAPLGDPAQDSGRSPP
jgi:hypothetical protein